jgi:hypothetical protein
MQHSFFNQVVLVGKDDKRFKNRQLIFDLRYGKAIPKQS